MATGADDVEVVHNEGGSRFETTLDGHHAVAEYRREGETIVFTHTAVPPEIEGMGVGNRLIQTALDFARDHGLAVVPACRFVAAFVRRHPEYRLLLRDA